LESRYRKKIIFTQEDHLIIEGSMVQKSNNRPMVSEDFEKQFIKTKDTPFDINYIDFDLDDAIFVPLKEINQLRRDLMILLESYLLKQFIQFQINRQHSIGKLHSLAPEVTNNKDIVSKLNDIKGHTFPTHILLSSIEHIDVLIELVEPIYSNIVRIYIDAVDFTQVQLISALSKLNNLRYSSESIHFDLYLSFPHVFFNQYQAHFLKKIFTLEQVSSNASYQFSKQVAEMEDLPIEQENMTHVQGFLVRTLGEIDMIKSINAYNHWDKKIALDYPLNIFNEYSIKFFEHDVDISSIAPSLELNGSGLRQLARQTTIPLEIPVYQRTALMHSANCIYKTSNKRCDYIVNGHFLSLYDRKGMAQQVKTHCQLCYNTIYNEKPQFLIDVWKDDLSKNSVMRLDFTTETAEELKEILGLWKSTIMNQTSSFNDKRFTRGHYKRGVK